MGILDIVPKGVITGHDVLSLFKYAKDNEFAIPAVNCTSSCTVVAILEAAKNSNSPIIIQISHGGAAYFAGKSLNNDKQQASIAGAVSAALYIRSIAPLYGIPVILHTDHCSKKLLPWLDGMLDADEQYFKKYGEPLFSSHMIDLSEEPKESNIELTKQYLLRAAPMKQWLEMEIGITGGEEDGINNEGVDSDKLYTCPEDVLDVYSALSPISPYFSIAAAFGNVHGVYAPGEYLIAIKYGVVKINIDTDTQYSFLEGVRNYILSKKDYLMSQVGNPEGENKPNKKFFDPRVWVREGEKSMSGKVQLILSSFKTKDTYPVKELHIFFNMGYSSNKGKWYFDKEDFKYTPSVNDGWSLEKEQIDRGKGVNFIIQVGARPQLTLSTAAVFLHRFYMRFSLAKYHYYEIAATCILLATKVEESCRKLRNIIIACAKVGQKNPDLIIDEQSKEYWRWRDVIIYNEEILLEALCFDLTIDHPYKDLLKYIKNFGGEQDTAKSAWAFVNDSIRTAIPVIYQPHIIAAAAFYFGTKHTSTVINSIGDKSWWEVINVDINEIKDVCKIMTNLYESIPRGSNLTLQPNILKISSQDNFIEPLNKMKELCHKQNKGIKRKNEISILESKEIKDNTEITNKLKDESQNIKKQKQ
ncbi:hypothetical protein PORY_000743 [Pneumocystis oryctolagi]|uniref:Uncharacterized protein n=1 Tax=Pneumocystis oryctolagi TaxID=42067 RepID=A0ACB7CE22_9ASCO|nr:hypothetical protein PORY_000743 [Pneumocystis oryctolagi]